MSERELLAREVHQLVSSELIKISFDLSRIASLVRGPVLEMLYASISDLDGLNSKLRQVIFNGLKPAGNGVDLAPWPTMQPNDRVPPSN
ncbi:hypothetical protein [Microlunatus sp. Gsoil 973]|uniref:hypothetical protein n=1 Tax=Microlunatus sp. Gsoil 973 TaxID=2672569 RepID=UPI0012B4E293|nr:hypothetical protein [Microlunatus sp. Gsoil 973]QGN33506.1 hypothetical protein GJV80_12570 [Microlunatus sp. Gsoil 973]